MNSPSGKISVFLCIVSLLFSFVLGSGLLRPETTFAQEGYEPLAELPGTTNDSGKATFATYIPGMFNLLIGMAAVLAVGVIVWGGVQYMTTTSITGKDEGREWISGALLGLLLVITSWLILYTINPALLEFDFNIQEIGGQNRFQACFNQRVETVGDTLCAFPIRESDSRSDVDRRFENCRNSLHQAQANQTPISSDDCYFERSVRYCFEYDSYRLYTNSTACGERSSNLEQAKASCVQKAEDFERQGNETMEACQLSNSYRPLNICYDKALIGQEPVCSSGSTREQAQQRCEEERSQSTTAVEGSSGRCNIQ